MNISRTKIFGLAATAGCSSYGFWTYRKRNRTTEFLALDPNEAVNNLNGNKLVGVSIKSLEALYHLNAHKWEEVAAKLNKTAWTHVCIYGSSLCRFILKDELKVDTNEQEISNLIHKIELDDKKWKKAMRWFSLNICSEDDLRCQDLPVEHKWSKMKKLNNLLRVILYKTELENCDRLVEEHVEKLLMQVVTTYRDEKHKNLVITALKCMANIARYSEKCASHIANSNWLRLLAEMIVDPILSEEPVLAHKILANMLFSFGASDYFFPSLVYELHRPNPDKEPILDVVFIHGFRASLFRTWRQKDKPGYRTIRFWPREWLPKEFHDDPIRIIGVDYASKLLQFGELVDSIETRSKKLMTELESSGVGRRPIVFVAHSMGGLIVKEILSKNKDLLDKTVGVVFIGTPHRGSPVLSVYLNYLRPSHDTKLLLLESEMSKELHSRFMENAVDQIPCIVSLIEIEKSPFFGSTKLIVTPESSILGRGAVYHVKENHYNMCKPENIHSTSYVVVLNLLKDAIRWIKQNN